MKNNEPKKVTFHLIKTPSYRTYFVDGMFGGLTTKGKIYAELFIERHPTPVEMIHQINDDHTLGDEVQADRKGKKGVIREIECGIMMDINTAISFKNWLEEKIKENEKVNRIIEEAKKK